jgi:hypothetical protein
LHIIRALVAIQNEPGGELEVKIQKKSVVPMFALERRDGDARFKKILASVGAKKAK